MHPVTKQKPNAFEACVAELPAKDDPRWQLWGPYMSHREWGTVRETHANSEGSNWTEFPYERAASTAYRYCEDGIFGLCDRECRVCHSYAFWNYRDDHLKERFYGLDNAQGAHGEDVKELYCYRAADPQYRYLCAEYIYPQTEYPYRHLPHMESRDGASEFAAARSSRTSAVSLTDFNSWHKEQRYFECEYEMCKLTPEQLYLQLSITNCGNETARIVAMPMIFLRNTWSPGHLGEESRMEKYICTKDDRLVICFKDPNGNETQLGYYFDPEVGTPEILLTDNVTSSPESSHSTPGAEKSPRPSKDAFHRYIVRGDSSGLLANLSGGTATRAGICYRLQLAPKQQVRLRCFLMSQRRGETAGFNWRGLTSSLDMVRLQNFVDACDALPTCLVPAEQDILSAAYTNLLWNRQFYPLDYMPHLWRRRQLKLPTYLVTVPDKWEQPYLAAWDTALHCLCLSCFDLRQAIRELLLLLALIRPDGSIYTDEYRPEGVTPPLIVLAAIDVYRKLNSTEKQELAPRIYSGLKCHLKWWLQRKDVNGVALIDGGICGMDYVSLFPRELVETGEGLIWAIFLVMRFFELSLDIYETPGSPLMQVIAEDLPILIGYLGRLCAVFVRNVAQENGLYHPYWLDVKACAAAAATVSPDLHTTSNSTAAATAPDAAQPHGSSSNNASKNKQDESSDVVLVMVETAMSLSTESVDQPLHGSKSSDSLDSLASLDGSSISFSGVRPRNVSLLAATENAVPSLKHPEESATTTTGAERQRCPWLHAYCYLPAICCCSLPNVRLPQTKPGDAATLEDLFAAEFNGPSDWETRSPFIYTNADHSRLFVTAINSKQLAELLEQVLSEIQFLAQYGVRTMSMLHTCDQASAQLRAPPPDTGPGTGPGRGQRLKQKFCPGASVSTTYGGNTNWYGGVNLPYNYLLLEALNRWSNALGNKFDLIEYPSYTGQFQRLKDIVHDLASRNVALFVPNANGIVPSTGEDGKRGTPLCETFDGDTGRGHGAAHKGGWSAIIVRILMIMHDLS